MRGGALEWTIEALISVLQSYGYFGTFLIGAIGNTVPFLPIPYLVPVFLLSSILDPLLIGVSVGLGASVGKSVSYLIGRGGAKVLSEEKQRQLNCFSKILGKYGAVAVFLFSASALPDDMIVIPFGMMKYSFTKFFLALFLGKTALALIVAYVGIYLREFATIFLGAGDIWVTTAVSIAFLIITIYIIMKVDWIEAAEFIDEKGVGAFIADRLRKARGRK